MEDTVTIRDVMTREFIGVSESDSAVNTAHLLREEGQGCAVVLRGQEAVGLVTEGDMLALFLNGANPEKATVSDVMHPGIVTVGDDMSLEEAAGMLTRGDAGRLVVLENEKPVGIVTEKDLVTASILGHLGLSEETEIEPNISEVDQLDTEYSNQSICEVCGSLTRDLVNVNGQLVCTDCRDI
ncbi:MULTISPECIES: cyclic nucleotide-binding/CBS domain-containing protein [unclassified Haladaptatus]|uniref:CBS domain-containing protein n=1 Tax=unclassified Haladaptatus TaxID=2622732 RepID=UPI0023E7E549|nr:MULTISPECIES: CBS domain-containing protein [unclassified Haladaptatus]